MVPAQLQDVPGLLAAGQGQGQPLAPSLHHQAVSLQLDGLHLLPGDLLAGPGRGGQVREDGQAPGGGWRRGMEGEEEKEKEEKEGF